MGYILGLYWDNGKEHGNYNRVYIETLHAFNETMAEARRRMGPDAIGHVRLRYSFDAWTSWTQKLT